MSENTRDQANRQAEEPRRSTADDLTRRSLYRTENGIFCMTSHEYALYREQRELERLLSGEEPQDPTNSVPDRTKC